MAEAACKFSFFPFLGPFFSPEVNGKDSIGVKLSHMKTGGYPGKLDLPLSLCDIEASQVAPCFQFCTESFYAIDSHNHESAQECEARSELWLMLHRWHCNGEDTGI